MLTDERSQPALPAGEGRLRPMLELRNVTKRYGGVIAVSDVSVAIHPGEVVALLGENGAGKSTLVGMASGRLPPDAGQVYVDGEPLTGAGPGGFSAAGVRLVPQELLLCPDMSVLDNILLGMMPTRARGVLNRSAARVAATERLHRLGVTHLDLNMPVGLLSVVDQAFVQIARSFTPDARVLLIDEPTSPMDDRDVDRFLAVIRTLTEVGTAIVYISHRLDEIFRLARTGLVMRGGRLVAHLAGAEMTRDRVVAEMVGGADLHDPVPRVEAGSREVALQCSELSGPNVDNISLTVREGEVVAVYGIAGSGRETLGSLLVGGTRRKSGSVSVRGRQLRSGDVVDAVSAGVGYVPAERRSQGLVLEASITANLTMGVLRAHAWDLPLRTRKLDAIAREWIEKLAIVAPGPSVPVGSLSGGSQQKVLLARWLAAGSRVLVLEEPTRGVDVGTKAEIYSLLHGLAREGAAIVVVTSDIEEATLVADRNVVLRGGQIVAELTSATQAELAHAAQSPEGVH